jgi:hypothetical protein
MMMAKWIAALAAASLATAPVTAQAAPAGRGAAPVADTESLGRGSAVAWVFAAVMVLGAILILTDDDDDVPVSP